MYNRIFSRFGFCKLCRVNSLVLTWCITPCRYMVFYCKFPVSSWMLHWLPAWFLRGDWIQRLVTSPPVLFIQRRQHRSLHRSWSCRYKFHSFVIDSKAAHKQEQEHRLEGHWDRDRRRWRWWSAGRGYIIENSSFFAWCYGMFHGLWYMGRTSRGKHILGLRSKETRNELWFQFLSTAMRNNVGGGLSFRLRFAGSGALEGGVASLRRRTEEWVWGRLVLFGCEQMKPTTNDSEWRRGGNYFWGKNT